MSTSRRRSQTSHAEADVLTLHRTMYERMLRRVKQEEETSKETSDRASSPTPSHHGKDTLSRDGDSR